MALRSQHKGGLGRVLTVERWSRGATSFLFIMAAAGLFVFSAVSPRAFSQLRAGVTDMAAPLLATIGRPVASVSDYIRDISGIAGLQADNARLREENARLREWYRTAQSLQAENQLLHNLLRIDLAPGETYVTARVIADSGNAYFKSVLVTSGGADGVQAGQAALADDGIIGRVVETGAHASRILLLGDINSRIPVMIEGGERAIMAGNNDETPQLLYLPQGAQLHDGQRVVTSGDGGLFPGNLPVGEVVKAANGWTVRPFTDIGRVGFVRIVNNGDDAKAHEVETAP